MTGLATLSSSVMATHFSESQNHDVMEESLERLDYSGGWVMDPVAHQTFVRACGPRRLERRTTARRRRLMTD